MIDRIFFKKGILFLIFTTVSCLISCKTTNSVVQNEIKAEKLSTQLEAFASKRLIELDEKMEKLLDSAIEAVIGMQFKELEINGADKIFEKYKRIKIEIIQRAFKNSNFSSLIPGIKQITKELNKLAINKDLLRSMEEDGIKNYYIREFNNRFMETLVEFSETGDYIDISLLKTIYAY